jgi:O-Antigen ligase
MTSSTSDARRRAILERSAAGPHFASPDSVWPAVLIVLLAILVFYLPNQAQFPVETGLRGLNVVNVLFILAFSAMLLCQWPRSEPMPLKWPLWGLGLALTFAVMVALVGDATAWVEDVTVYKNTLFYPMLFVLYFFAVRDMRVIRLLLGVTLFIFFTSSVLGIRQALDYGIAQFHDLKRVAAPFGWNGFDANRSAIFFCIHLQLIGACALFMKSRPLLRTACFVLYAMGVFVVFFTYSRQALAILVVAGLLLLARKQILLAAALVVALVNYELWVPEAVVERVQTTTLDPFEFELRKEAPVVWNPVDAASKPYVPDAPVAKTDGLDPAKRSEPPQVFDGSTESRFILWKGAWELIKERPWGIGLNRFKRYIGNFVPLDLAGKDAHNVYVLFATEASLLAPLALLALLIASARIGWRIARFEDDDEARALGVGIVMATLAVALGNVYGSRFFDGDVMGNYWVVLALGARFLVIKESEARLRAVAKDKQAAPRGAYLGPRGSPLKHPV